jgi:two-component system sensor histidine kinase PhoQ
VDWDGLLEPTVAFVLCADQAPYRQSMTQFRYELIAGFGALALSLSLMLLIVLRWGLRPLRHIRQQLLQLEQGDRQSLDAVQPQELTPLVESLNQYIAHQSALRNRHRQSLDDLSHSLKTPLSVLRLGVAETHPDLALLQEQVARMQNIVDHQLSRVARIAQAEAASEQPWVSIDGVIRQLLRALAVAYPSHQFDYLAGIDWQLRIHEDDLLDMLGNVMENACKYGNGQLRVSLREGVEQSEASKAAVQIGIEDNGPGIASDLMEAVLRRGVRLDSREAGQGIGLAMVSELLEIYDGDMSFAASSLGGAKVILGFQQARPTPVSVTN